MTLNVCPADTVSASIERVWALLKEPRRCGDFWDFTVERVEPDGPAAAGQKLVGWTAAPGRRWPIEGAVEEVDELRHQIAFRMTLPFGVVGENRIVCQSIDDRQTLVRFG